jgi:hypothetical protein
MNKFTKLTSALRLNLPSPLSRKLVPIVIYEQQPASTSSDAVLDVEVERNMPSQSLHSSLSNGHTLVFAFNVHAVSHYPVPFQTLDSSVIAVHCAALGQNMH